jgi:hypothetical protein
MRTRERSTPTSRDSIAISFFFFFFCRVYVTIPHDRMNENARSLTFVNRIASRYNLIAKTILATVSKHSPTSVPLHHTPSLLSLSLCPKRTCDDASDALRRPRRRPARTACRTRRMSRSQSLADQSPDTPEVRDELRGAKGRFQQRQAEETDIELVSFSSSSSSLCRSISVAIVSVA